MKGRLQKLTLKTDALPTQKTPQKPIRSVSKTPKSRSPAYRSGRDNDRIDPIDLFQKVCCPNCRFLFKIIKNTQMLSPTPPKRKEPTKSSSLTQTDDSLMKEIFELKSLNQELSKQLVSKRSDQAIFKSNTIKIEMTKIQESLSQYIKQKSYKIENMNGSKLTQVRRNNIIPDKRSEISSPMLKSKKDVSAREKDSSRRNTPKNDKNEIFFKKFVNQEQLKGIVIQNHQNKAILHEIFHFQLELAASIDIPAYQKMIIQDFLNTSLGTETS